MRRLAIAVLVLAWACTPRPAPRAGSGPTVVACTAAGCPATTPGDSAAIKEGGELRGHVEDEPALLCDLIEHDFWSRWLAENQVTETLFFQDPWTGQVSGRLAE